MSKPNSQIDKKSLDELRALPIHGHQTSSQNAEDIKKLWSLLAEFEKTYSEPYRIPLSFEQTQEDKVFKDYLIHALNNIKLKFQSSETFSPSDYLKARTIADNSVKQYVVILRKHESGEYKLNFRIGDKQHVILGIGNDHFSKYLAIPAIKELSTTSAQAMDIISESAAACTARDTQKQNVNISPNTKPNTKSPVISAAKIPLDAYKEVTKQHLISEMPVVLLAGEIIYSTNPLTGKPQLEVNDKSGAFHFSHDILPKTSERKVQLQGINLEAPCNSVVFDKAVTRIYDQRLCIEQVMRVVGLTGDLIRYVPKVEIDMNQDPRILNKRILRIQPKVITPPKNTHNNIRHRAELTALVWSEPATETARRHSSIQATTNAPDATFSAATHATTVTNAMSALVPNQNLSPVLQAAIGNTTHDNTTAYCSKICVIL